MSVIPETTEVVRTHGDGPAEPATDAGQEAPAGAHGRRRRRRRLAAVLLAAVGLAALVLVLVVALLTGTTTGALDPDSVAPTGSRALARVLADHGVRVDIARGVNALLAAGVDGDTTVVVTDTQFLDQLLMPHVEDATASAGRIVITTDDPVALHLFGLDWPVVGYPASSDPAAVDCGTTDVRAGELLGVVDSGFLVSASPAVHPCFVSDDVAAYVVTERSGEPQLAAFADPMAWTNERILTGDTGALALRAMGHTGRVVWYVPTADDLRGSSDRVIRAALPRWFMPSLWLVGAALAALALVRGRRLGRLVREPLPVVVRAIETTRARGALYRRSRDTGRAGAILRSATLTRLRRRLGLPSHASAEAVSERLAAVSGRTASAVAAVLTGPLPADEAALGALARDLTALEDLSSTLPRTEGPS